MHNTTHRIAAALLPFALLAQIEVEPNNSDATANAITLSSDMLGAMGSACTGIADNTDDHFVINLPFDCTLRITTVSNNPTAAQHNLNIDVRQNGSLLFTSNRVTGNNGNDSIVTNTHLCIAKGVYHLRLWRAFETCYQYTLRVTAVPALYGDDAEPNDDFAGADTHPVLAENAFAEGHVAFTYGNDADDRYRIQLTGDGTLNVNLNSSRDGDIVGHSLIVDLYKDGASIWTMQGIAGQENTSILTQGTVQCLSAGTYYLGVRPFFGCGFSYRLSYDLTPPVNGNDAEPNNTATQADALPALIPDTWRDGHFNFNYASASGADNADWHRLQTSGDGTLVIEVFAARVEGAGSMLVNVFRGGTQINSFSAAVGGAGNPAYTTAAFPCYGEGDYYIALQPANYCGVSYRLKYSLQVPVFSNDPEPNGSADGFATWLQPDQTEVDGHLNFTHNGENDDRWRINLAADGPLVMAAQAEKFDAGTGNISVTLHNNAGSTVGASNIAVGGQGVPAMSTLNFPSLTAGYYVLRLAASNGCGISYRLSCTDANSDGLCDGFGQVMGVDELGHALTMSLYPNPVAESLQIQLPPGTTGEAVVLDAVGRAVLRERLAVGAAGIATLSTAALPAACYLLRIEGADGTASRAFVKE